MAIPFKGVKMINPKRVLELVVALAFIFVSSQFVNAAIL